MSDGRIRRIKNQIKWKIHEPYHTGHRLSAVQLPSSSQPNNQTPALHKPKPDTTRPKPPSTSLQTNEHPQVAGPIPRCPFLTSSALLTSVFMSSFIYRPLHFRLMWPPPPCMHTTFSQLLLPPPVLPPVHETRVRMHLISSRLVQTQRRSPSPSIAANSKRTNRTEENKGGRQEHATYDVHIHTRKVEVQEQGGGRKLQGGELTSYQRPHRHSIVCVGVRDLFERLLHGACLGLVPV